MTIRSGWLAFGAIAASGCGLFAALLVAGYVRHMPTGDQAGAALGLMFLLVWLLPAATVPMVLGTGDRKPASDGLTESRVPGWVSALLLGSGCVLIVLVALYVAIQIPALRGGVRALKPIDVLHVSSYATSLSGFAGIWIALGLVGRRRMEGGPPKALPAIFLFTALAAMFLNAELLLEGFRGTYPGEDRWSLLVRNLLYFSTPSLVLTMLLVWGAWNLTRGRHVVRG